MRFGFQIVALIILLQLASCAVFRYYPIPQIPIVCDSTVKISTDLSIVGLGLSSRVSYFPTNKLSLNISGMAKFSISSPDSTSFYYNNQGWQTSFMASSMLHTAYTIDVNKKLSIMPTVGGLVSMNSSSFGREYYLPYQLPKKNYSQRFYGYTLGLGVIFKMHNRILLKAYTGVLRTRNSFIDAELSETQIKIVRDYMPGYWINQNTIVCDLNGFEIFLSNNNNINDLHNYISPPVQCGVNILLTKNRRLKKSQW